MNDAKDNPDMMDMPDNAVMDVAGYAEGLKPVIDTTPIKVAAKRPERMSYALDLVSSKMFGAAGGTFDKMTALKAERSGSQAEVSVMLQLNFDALKSEGVTVNRELTSYDKRVYMAVASLYEAGNECMTASQIHAVMGNEGRPSLDQVKRINEALTKMSGARIYISNHEEVAAKYNYPKYTYDGHLLPMERVTAEINGRITEAAIHLLREPPLIDFAKGRKQMGTIPREVLESPVNKTEGNLSIDHYLLERITRQKSNPRILLETLYEKCGVTDRRDKPLKRRTMKSYLDHYTKVGFIAGYKMDRAAITIQLAEPDHDDADKEKDDATSEKQ